MACADIGTSCKPRRAFSGKLCKLENESALAFLRDIPRGITIPGSNESMVHCLTPATLCSVTFGGEMHVGASGSQSK